MVDWIQQIKQLVDVDFPDAEKLLVVCDNLNTHRLASLYEGFPTQVASSLADKLDICDTPKHGL
jgi:hypothetical protein